MNQAAIDKLAALAGVPRTAPPAVRLEAALETMGGGGVRTLAAKYNGGKELHDSSGHLPRDAGGYYVSRTTGERLLIDDGYADLGIEIGTHKPYGLLGATVVGAPATARRSGFDAFSASAYVVFAITEGNAYTTWADASFSAHVAYATAFSSQNPANLDRTSVNNFPSGSWRQLIQDGSAPAVELLAAGYAQDTTRYLLASAYDGATGDRRIQGRTTAGVLVSQDEDLGGSDRPDIQGPWSMGAFYSNTTYYWRGDIHVALGWDGVAKTQAEISAISAAYAAGATLQELCDTYAPDLCTDGMVAGAYDQDNPTMLPTLNGTGAAVTAEYPT